jgi:hypothetical protein
MIGNTALISSAASGRLINFIAFQLGWWCCVLGAANGDRFLGPFAVALIVIAHLLRARRMSAELLLVAITVALGAAWDTLMLHSGWISYAAGFSGAFAPLWILALWAVFATTFNVSMHWLRERKLLAAAFGAVAAPLSYWAGVRLGAGALINPIAALVAISIGWAAMMPALMWLSQKLDGYAE